MIKSESLLLFPHKYFTDKVLRVCTQFHTFWPSEPYFGNISRDFNLWLFLTSKGQLPSQEVEDCDSKSPEVHMEGVSPFAFKKFWCHVIKRATKGLSSLARKVQLRGQSEVRNFDFESTAQEQIRRFDVPVHNLLLMHEAQSSQ